MQENKRSKGRGKKAGPVFLALLVILAAAAVFLIQRYMPTKERMAPAAYFGALGENQVALVLQDHLTEQKGLLEDQGLYLNYEMVRDEINSRFYWDEPNGQMIFTTALETYDIPVDSAAYTVDGESREYERPIVISRDGTLYLSADFLQLFTNLEWTLTEEEGICHGLLRYQWGTQRRVTVRKNAPVRYQGGIKSPILTELQAGDSVQVLEEFENWLEVVTPDGYVGYVSKRRVGGIQETEVTREFQETEYTSLTREEKINLVWHQIDYEEANQYLSEDIADMTGVNVISPTWFSVLDNEGAITSFGDAEYVKTAHEAGLEVWGLINNFSPEVDTTTLLASTAARRRMADTLVSEAKRLEIEGINLDFEYIKEECGYSYVQFVRELSIACRKNNLVLSVDVPVPMDFNQHFNRKELGTVADYVIVMGYDEHYAGSETAGSVASLSFEENGITETLKAVPAEKIISGVPFYTRIWYTVYNEDGTTTVTSEALSMESVEKTLETYGVVPEWNEETSQYYAAWVAEDGTLCEIWIEDEESLALKAGLVGTYDLGGIAAWVLGSEKASIWPVIQKGISS